MKFALIGSCALVGAVVVASAHAGPAGTLLFTQPGTQILDTKGAARPALRGGVLQDGERLITPPGAISQIKLPDGSLIGLRPDSELKLIPSAVADATAPQGVSLVRGAARVIGVELMDDKKVSNFRFQSGPAVLQMQGADLESAVTLPTGGAGKPAPGDNGPGSYQRLLIGSARVGNGPTAEPLVPRQVSFMGGPNAALVTMASVSKNIFADNRVIDSRKLGSPFPPTGPNPLPLQRIADPTLPGLPIGFPTPPLTPINPDPVQRLPILNPVPQTPSFEPPPVVIVKTCPRLLVKTCVG